MALFGKKKGKAVEEDAALTPTEEPVREKTVESDPATPKLKVRADAYTLLLGLSVVALAIACVLLYLNMAEYGSSPMAGIK